VICLLAFAAHWKVWKQERLDGIRFLSGMYYVEISYDGLQEVEWTDRLPQMERQHGFSAGAREKGVFLDSLEPGKEAHVLVDDLRQPKIRIAYLDSMVCYLNFADSLETTEIYGLLKSHLEAGPDLRVKD
jgi:hypothetical protein